jgi:hypothetical protein
MEKKWDTVIPADLKRFFIRKWDIYVPLVTKMLMILKRSLHISESSQMLCRVILIDVLNKPSARRMHGLLRKVGNVWNSPRCDLPKDLNLEVHIVTALEIYNVKCVLHSHVSKLYSNSDDYKFIHVY